MGVATFNGTTAGALDGMTADIPIAQVNTPVLAAPRRTCARCGAPARRPTSGRHQRVSFRRTADMLFGCIAVAEADFAARTPRQRPVPTRRCTRRPRRPTPRSARRSTRRSTRTCCACGTTCRTSTATADGTERYRQFNTARQHALHACGRAVAGSVPAASALGAASDSPLVVYFLAGRTPPLFVENPRQVSAYHYPRQYGTHSPVFSRAALLRQSGSLTLFVSGTSSIVGHRSLHVGDTAAQTRETLTNIEALVGEANRVARGAHFDLRAAGLQGLRAPPGRPAARSRRSWRQALGTGTQILYLQADICRADLLVEIEATAIMPADGRGLATACAACVCQTAAPCRALAALAALAAATTHAEEKPLWEVGLGAGFLVFNDYRGAATTHVYPVPVPYFIYRGKILKSDRDGLRGVVPQPGPGRAQLERQCHRPRCATTRRDTACRTCAPRWRSGRTLNVHLWRSADRARQARPAAAGARRADPPGLPALRRRVRRAAPRARPRPVPRAMMAGSSDCSPVRCSPTAATTTTSIRWHRSTRRRGPPGLYQAHGGYAGTRDAGLTHAPLPQVTGSAHTCATTRSGARASRTARWSRPTATGPAASGSPG